MTQDATYTETWLVLEQALGGRPVLKGTALEMRIQYEELGKALAAQSPASSPLVHTVDHHVDGLALRIYTPAQPKTEGPLPMCVFAHGGGLIMGNVDSEDPQCRAIAEHTGVVVVSVDYRLAPENKTPAQLEDMLRVLKWVYENASELGGNRNKILIAGTSSGAGLALAVTRVTVLGQARIPKDAIKGTVALGPVTLHPDNVPSNLADRYLSRVEYGSNVPVIDKNVIDECFASAGLQADDQYFVGSDQSNHRLFPPTYIATCEIDPLRDDGITLAESLKASGVSVQHDHYNGLPHCFWLFPSLPETPVFMKNLFLGVTRLLGSR